jgi:hypothetical protein
LSNGGNKTLITESGTAIDGGPVTWIMDGTSHGKIPMLVGFLGGGLAVEWTLVNEFGANLFNLPFHQPVKRRCNLFELTFLAQFLNFNLNKKKS